MKFFAAALALTSTMLAPVSGTSTCPDEYQEADTVTKLDFFESTVVTNTLHLDGGELRYNNVGVFENKVLDLQITITGGDYTDIEQVWVDREKPPPEEMNGKKPGSKFGNINLQTVKNKPKSGEAQLQFCIVEEGTNTPVTLEEFYFTTYDTDERGVDSGVGIKEKLVINTSQVTLFQLMEDTEIITTCEDGTSPPCQWGRTVFTSSTAGPGSDNPTDPNSLTDLQKARSITFTFQDTSCWEFTYDHYCPADQDDWTGSEQNCQYYTGGNFLFAGDSEEIRIDGECNTPVPTPFPSNFPTSEPTFSPTASPTVPSPSPTWLTPWPTTAPSLSPTKCATMSPSISPTEVPTVSPTDPHTPMPSTSSSPTLDPYPPPPFTTSPSEPPTIPPAPCPEDVVLVKIVGITEIAIEGAVRILSQNTTAVTVRLYNAWTSQQDAIDSIFYQYRETDFSEKCYEEQNIPGNDDYADITIQCNHHSPFTNLDIWVADAAVDGNATIPKCCKGDVPIETPVVFYKLLVYCDSQCVEASERRSLRGVARLKSY